jgi:hypothetical protein
MMGADKEQADHVRFDRSNLHDQLGPDDVSSHRNPQIRTQRDVQLLIEGTYVFILARRISCISVC